MAKTSPLPQVARAADKAALASFDRDTAIIVAVERGETIRAVAAAARLSPARVHQIVHGR